MDLAKKRRTSRMFSSNPIDFKDVTVALETACQAPSGANYQPWRFLIVIDPQMKRRIRSACERGEKGFYSKVKGDWKDWLSSKGLSWRKPFLEEAPLLVLVLSERRAPYSVQSVWLAIGYILLALEELGLGTLTYTPSITEGVLEVTHVPKKFRLEAILPIGISIDEKTKETRRALCEVAYMESWGHGFDKAALPRIRAEMREPRIRRK